MAWITALVFIIVGIVIGFVMARLTAQRRPHQQDLEKELEKSRYELEQYRQELMDHFDQSAELLENISKDYNKLYHHMAKTSAELMPNLPEQDNSFARRLTKIAHLIETVPAAQKPQPPASEQNAGASADISSDFAVDLSAPQSNASIDATAKTSAASEPTTDNLSPVTPAQTERAESEITAVKNSEAKAKKIEKEHEDEAILTP